MAVPFWRTRRQYAAAVAYAALAIVCTRVPLLNYLGFESSVVIAVAASLIAGPGTIIATRAALRGPDRAAVVPVFFRALRRHLFLLGIPAAILALNALVVKNCSLPEGIVFYLLIPCVTAVFASCLGFFCAAHYRRPTLLYFLFAAATVAYALALGYFTPAIFSYNFFYGYFPGLTYDEILGVSASLLLFRLLTLLAALFLFWMALILVKETAAAAPVTTKGFALLRAMAAPRHRLAAAAFLIVFALAYLFRCPLGFESTASYIRQQLGAARTFGHFRIYYPAGSYSDEEIRMLAGEHEFRLAQVLDAFALTNVDTIDSYVYPSPDAKRRLTGAGNTDIAKPWNREIHISRQSADVTLKHELVHVVVGEFGLPIIRANFSTGLVEGIAMAVEWNWGNRTLHQYAAALRRYSMAPDIRGIMSFTGFASQTSSLSYVLAGSFCRYLIDRYGMRLMARLYGGSGYERAYGRSLSRLVTEWEGFLDTHIDVDESDHAAVDMLVRQPPIFRKVCARVIAGRNKEAWDLFAARQYGRAEELFRLSYDEAGGYDALNGRLISALRQGEYDSVTAAFETIVGESDHPDRYLPLFLTAGDAYQAKGATARARACYEHVYDTDFSLGYTEAAALRLSTMNDSAAAAPLLAYFLADVPDSVRLSLLDSLGGARDPVTSFLRGKVLLRLGQYARAHSVLDAVSLAGEDPLLEAQRLRMAGSALFRLGEYDEARIAFWLSLNTDDVDVAEDDMNEWIDRCEWFKRNMQ